MNCKPGDLARVVAPGYFVTCTCGVRTLVVKPDTMVVCARPYADGWFLEEPVRISGTWACGAGPFSGTTGSLPDHLLRPIRPQPDNAVDEMVRLVGAAPKTLSDVREVTS